MEKSTAPIPKKSPNPMEFAKELLFAAIAKSAKIGAQGLTDIVAPIVKKPNLPKFDLCTSGFEAEQLFLFCMLL